MVFGKPDMELIPERPNIVSTRNQGQPWPEKLTGNGAGGRGGGENALL